LFAILGLLALIVYGCGGSSSSTTGPSTGGGGGTSGAVIQGQLRSRTAANGESVVVVALEKVLGIGIAEAAIAPLGNITVQLVDPGNPAHVIDSTTTDANGNFLFTAVTPGVYRILVPGFTLTPNPTLITVDVGDKGIVDGVVEGDKIQATASVTVNDINEFPQNTVQLCKAITIAKLTNASLAQVINDRLSGEGWGNIVKKNNGNPGMLGTPGNCTPDEIAAASSLASGKGNANGNGNANANGNGKGKKKGQS